MAIVEKAFSSRDVLLEHSSKGLAMQPTSLSGRQQQLGLLMGRAQPDVLEAARVAALLNGQSGSFNLQSGNLGLGSGSLSGLGGAPAGLNLGLGSLPQPPQPPPQPSQLALPDQLALLSQFPHALFPQQYGSVERDLQQLGSLRNVGKTRSSDSRSSSAYASRHQAAEQRRRTRINERLELLRKLVPHAERANTACFLEEVIKYIEALKRRTLELESMLEAATGKPVAKSLALPTAMPALDPNSDSQAPSPRHPGSTSGQAAANASAAQQLLGGGGGSGAGQAAAQAASGGAGNSASPLLTSGAALSSGQQGQQQQQSEQAAPQQQQQQQQPSPLTQPQLQLSQAAAAQLAQLLPSSAAQASLGQSAAQQQQQQLLFSQPSGGLSLGGGHGSSLSSLAAAGSGALGGSMSLAHLTAGLQAQHGLSAHGLPAHLSAASAHHLAGLSSHGHHHHHHSHGSHMAQQLSELQSIHVMHTLQQQHQQHQSRASHHPPTFHPTNNKAAVLQFNEDLFGGIKPELLQPSRSLLGAAATSATPSTSLQLTTAQLPADSNTNTLVQQVETARKAMSGSPGTSEESGVPLKKRRVLLL